MYIERHMITPALTVKPDTLLPEVKEILTSHKFRHLPVVDHDNRLIGMISDRDIRSAYPSSVLEEEKRRTILDEVSKTKVEDVMGSKIFSLSPLSTLDDALHLLSRGKVGLLPVVDEDRQVIGVFSVQDLMKAYKNLYGIGEKGSFLIALEDDGQPKPLTRIVRVLEEMQISFSRLSRVKGENNKNIIYLRVQTFNINLIHKAFKEIGMKIIKD
ncbi:MAG: CBS domain-containing protein [Desulfobulbaceae bacterium]|nr:CBS domain-containing protein [Desulfobulbaceae bacterium]